MTLDETVVQRVNDLGTCSWTGETFRHTSQGRDPLSGAGARRFGGRWNPADLCSTLYLARPLTTCLDEYARMAQAAGQEPLQMLSSPRQLHTIEVNGLEVLDLREEEALAYVGLTLEDITDDDWTACQSVGHAAYFLDFAGVIAPSATGSGLVIAAFEGRAQPTQLSLRSSLALDAGFYQQHHGAS